MLDELNGTQRELTLYCQAGSEMVGSVESVCVQLGESLYGTTSTVALDTVNATSKHSANRAATRVMVAGRERLGEKFSARCMWERCCASLKVAVSAAV